MSAYDQGIELVDSLARPMTHDEYRDSVASLASELAARSEAAENEAA